MAADRRLTSKLTALGQAIVAAKARVRDCDLAHRKVAADVARLTDAVLEAHAVGADDRAAVASKQRAALESTTLRDAAERLEGAKLAVTRAEADRGLFARENVDRLLAEWAPESSAVAQAVEDAVEQLGQAHSRWNAVEAELLALLRLAGRNTGNTTRFPEALATLIRDAKREGGAGVPAPGPSRHPQPQPVDARRSAA